MWFASPIRVRFCVSWFRGEPHRFLVGVHDEFCFCCGKILLKRSAVPRSVDMARRCNKPNFYLPVVAAALTAVQFIGTRTGNDDEHTDSKRGGVFAAGL